MKISSIDSKVIKNSRQEDTIEVKLSSNNNLTAQASVPQGKSTGKKEAVALSAQQAKENIDKVLFPFLKEKNFVSQSQFDNLLIELDGTENKSHLGANTLLSLSLAFARLKAKENKQSLYQYLADIAGTKPDLPAFYMNLINGGEHATNNLEWQEYITVIQAENAQKQLAIGDKIFNVLEDKLKTMNKQIKYGDEGGYDISFKDYKEPLKILYNIIQKLGFEKQVSIALDTAANSFSTNDGHYYNLNNTKLSFEKLKEIYLEICNNFPLISIEDPFDESQPKYYATLKEELQQKTLIIGDDLTATNPALVKKSLQEKTINGLIVKPNQIGTLTETIETIKIAKENDLKIIVSHRSGETNDDFIADLSYGTAAFGLKAGAPNSKTKERLVKYQRIIDIS